MTERADGRRERGRRKRARLVAATLRVVERDGVAGVTHRAVADEAGLAKTAGTYYFDSIDDLLIAALTEDFEKYANELANALGGRSSPAQLAKHLADYLHRQRRRTIAEYELYLLAARRPALRPAALRWYELMDQVAASYTEDPVARTAFVATVDGLFVRSLVEAQAPSQDRVRAVLEHVLASAEATASRRRVAQSRP